MKFAETDSSDFPVVVVKINPVNATLDEVSAHMEESLQFMRAQQEPFVVIYDLTQVNLVPKDLNLHFGKWIKTYEGEFRKHMLGLACVSPSIIPAVALKTVFMISPPPVTHYTVLGNLPEAVTWAHGIIEGQKD